MLNYEKIINATDFVAKNLSKEFDAFSEAKSIIVCGNGTSGYNKEYSGNFIDSHDLVVRINNYVTIPELTGKKTDVLFAGACSRWHLKKERFYPDIDKFETIISYQGVIDALKSIEKIKEQKIIIYDILLLKKTIESIGYKSKHGISGIHCALLFLAISKKFNSKIDFLGFDIQEKDKEKEIYYYGIRKINKGHLKHDWDFHANFFSILYDKNTSI